MTICIRTLVHYFFLSTLAFKYTIFHLLYPVTVYQTWPLAQLVWGVSHVIVNLCVCVCVSVCGCVCVYMYVVQLRVFCRLSGGTSR